ncbi:bifunctional phosphopantothenoylcysteine decarboxylase/phosphopantothenate--cysteine ligase CoaBC [Geothermobacter hydrogeniphilus]|uniref:Coenzyme A biosynthesis bifunctional protein CoaBC n=1 Tax=Geothermobacter hydrogeniphilus TaxID=1969733 RepID=A0A2K2H8T4_9BACT|nr:bifunctional phosphopantothenoylcysteine decarboxylase/phosphopantothenate--cysteine ligase CoaBC [Geothermobacter hydrogeniphilus]PNU19630.1 bifunctional phosphopantothenoylcysteine decarboxylase/phosphopantothenate--cysteine ligase CoaBC [Geothermobacter hydrogeniphilus]
MFSGKQVVIGVCGGIAAYKAAELVRLFVKAGAEVQVVMTRHAAEFVTPLTFQTLSGNPVHSELFNLLQEREIGHISLADRADLMVIAPATANLVGKVAGGLADDLLSTTLMATRAPVLFAPAMNVNMYENPLYQRNQAALVDLGYHFIEPVVGELACGWQGKGKLPEPEAILEAARGLLRPADLAGETVLVTAGPTREEIDPVRYISNYSSGKMGYAIAAAAARRGARVLLVSGPTCLPRPAVAEFISVTSAVEMRDAVMNRVGEAGMVFKAAAVADYRPIQRAERKIKKGAGEAPLLELERNPDILAELGELNGPRLLIGFAAETDQLVAHAAAKLKAKNLDLIVANDVTREGAGFDVETNIVRLLYRDGRNLELPRMSKTALADRLLDEALEIKRRRSEG